MKLERVQALKLPYGDASYHVLGSRRGLFLTDSGRYMCRIDPDDYEVSWEIPWKRHTWQKFVSDTLIASHGAGVWGLNPDTGETLWEHEAKGCLEHGEDRLLLLLESGYMVIDPRTGAVDSRVAPPSFRGHPFCIDRHSAVLVGENPDRIDADTGNVTNITGRAGDPDPRGVWGDYAVSLTTGTLDLYHLDGTSMRLKFRNEARTAIDALPDLILVEPTRLRIVRLVQPSTGSS